MHTQIASVSSAPQSFAYRGGYPAVLPGSPCEPDALDAIGTVVSVPRGSELYAQGDAADSWYRVTSGVLRTCKLLPDGRRQIDAFLLPGDFLGFEGLSDHSFGAEAITQATVIRYSRTRIEKLAEENSSLGIRLLKVTLKRLSDANQRLTLLGRKTAEEKLASFLVEMLDRLDTVDTIDLPMSRSDIADYLGLTIETVSRTFTALKADGILALLNAHKIIVLDRETLEDLSGGD